ncbi:MAG: sugar kinase [Bacteroidia bacterium]|nr:sugar kinase [Bacteroidia bacterium]
MKRIICTGEIMIRLTPPGHQRLTQTQTLDVVYGGSESNVAISLAQWGLPVRYLTRVPAHDLGTAALRALATFGVDTSACVRGGERLGVYYLEMGIGKRPSRVIYDRAYSGMATLAPGMIPWPTVLTDAGWFHWSGITPALSATAAAAMAEAVHAAADLGLILSCDLNHRSALWQYGITPAEIMPPLVSRCQVLMGDPDAFRLYFGLEADQPDTLLRHVMTRFPDLRYVAMSRRRGHSATHNTYQVLGWNGQQFFASAEHDLPDIQDRIGSGDASMAGLIYALCHYPDQPQLAVDLAAAAGAWKHYVPGDANLVSIPELESLISGHSGGRVQR